MHNEAIETFTHKGVEVNIYQEEDPESPDQWGNTDLFLVAFHRDFYVEREGFDRDTCIAVQNGGKDEYGEKNEDAKSILKRFHVFGLEAYIHSGVVLALSSEGNFPDRRWDVSQLGLVFVEKTNTRTRKAAHKLATSLINEWNQYLSGDVYGYVAGNDSCRGYYGIEYAREEAKSAAEYEAKEIIKRHATKKKAEIKNHVPLNKRTRLQFA